MSKMGIRHIDDVVDYQGQLLSLPHAMATHGLGMHHMPIWQKIRELLQPFLLIPPLSHEHKLADWKLCLVGLNIHPMPLCKLTSIKTYRLLQSRPWIHTYANNIWHLQKPLNWWTQNMDVLWKTKLPFKTKALPLEMHQRHTACGSYSC